MSDILEIKQWAKDLEKIAGRIRKHFARIEAFDKAKEYLEALLSPIDRKNGWQIAEATGDKTPDRVQNLIARAQWDADKVRDDLQNYVTEHLGNENGILVLDETGFLKQGNKSVGVQRQYSGTAGGVDNCQIGVFLGYTTLKGHTLIDRELYLPESWTNNRERCEEAGVPNEVEFHTKPELARKMLERAFSNGIPGKWVTADSVYGDNEKLRQWLKKHKKPYVLQVSSNIYVWKNLKQIQVSALVSEISENEWKQLSAGNGSKGPRIYDWARVPLNNPEAPEWEQWLLLKKRLNEKGEIEINYYFVFCPTETTLEEIVQVAGSRWTIEEGFKIAKNEVGLDQYEVRIWQGWYRHITLVLFALAFLTVVKSQQSLQKKGVFKMKTHNMMEFKNRQKCLSL